MYDLVLKGGRVVDPSSGLDGALDVAVENGRIARVAAGIAPADARRVVEVGGKIVTPGLIDLHAHVFEGINRTGVNPDLGGVYSGVTTIVDAGSAGAATFGGWRHILPVARPRSSRSCTSARRGSRPIPTSSPSRASTLTTP